MSNEDDRAKGKVEELGGKVKSGVGSAIGNKQMEAEGRADELKGDAHQRANE